MLVFDYPLANWQVMQLVEQESDSGVELFLGHVHSGANKRFHFLRADFIPHCYEELLGSPAD